MFLKNLVASRSETSEFDSREREQEIRRDQKKEKKKGQKPQYIEMTKYKKGDPASKNPIVQIESDEEEEIEEESEVEPPKNKKPQKKRPEKDV
jgi:hypothetical protein